MVNNIEDEIYIDFLEKAQERLNVIKNKLLLLSNNSVEDQKKESESILRLLHNIKGEAGLMSLAFLSNQTHQLEEVFKILNSEKASLVLIIDTEIELLLLACVDCLCQIVNFSLYSIEINKDYIDNKANFIYKKLWQKFYKLQANSTKAIKDQEETNCSNLEVARAEVGGSLVRLEPCTNEVFEPKEEALSLCQEFDQIGEKLKLDDWKRLYSSVVMFLESHPDLAHSLIMLKQANTIPKQLEIDVINLVKSELGIVSFDSQLAVEPLKLSAPVEEVEVTPIDSNLPTSSPTNTCSSRSSSEPQESTVRIPSSQLDKLREEFEELTIDHYGVEHNIQQLLTSVRNLCRRVQKLEHSNAQLRFAHEKFSSQETKELLLLRENNELNYLEMEQCSELYTSFQEEMQSIVQLQEESTDLKLGLDEIAQVSVKQKRSLKQIQDILTQTRTRPLSELLNRFPHYIKDLSLKYSKKVELTIEGGENLIDRKVLEALGDPLIHLLRNAFDHGIEQANIRQLHGKPFEGKIQIKAYRRKEQVVITVSDDGGGIDVEKIRLRAIQDGLLSNKQLKSATNTDFINLIFEPGFSTVDEVTFLSGQGVGLDVVRTNLELVRGNVRVDTEAGLGTTFTLTVPFALSLLRVFLVEVKGFLLAFPTDTIEEIIPLKSAHLFSVFDRHLLNYKGSLIPSIELGKWLEYRSSRRRKRIEGDPDINVPSLLIMNQGITQISLQIERYWGEREVTIRQPESNVLMPIGFRGCAVLDGRVVPLVNSTEMLQWLTSGGESYQTLKLPSTPSTTLISHFYSNQGFVNTSLPFLPQIKEEKCILVVDDSVTVRRFLAVSLEKANFEVEQAQDGLDALDKLNAGLNVDVVICDIEMPRLNGYDFLSKIKEQEKFSQIPVVMLSSRIGENDRQIAFERGASAYLSKPYNEQNLLSVLRNLEETRRL